MACLGTTSESVIAAVLSRNPGDLSILVRENAKTIDGLGYMCPKMRRQLLLHLRLLHPLEVPEMRNQPNMINPILGRRDRGIVRIRRIVKERRYLNGKSIYKHQQLELTIPAKFKDIIEPFMHTDLKIEVR